MHIVNVIHWNIMTDEGRGRGKNLLGMKTRRLCRDSIAAFQYLRGGCQDEARLTTEVCDRRTRKIEMPTLHNEKSKPL